jgi:hypothetical protein
MEITDTTQKIQIELAVFHIPVGCRKGVHDGRMQTD